MSIKRGASATPFVCKMTIICGRNQKRKCWNLIQCVVKGKTTPGISTWYIIMKTLMNTAMKTIMKSSLCALAALVLSSSSAFATALDTTLFAKKSVLTISGYSGSTTLANFPVLVRLSAGSPSGFAYADVTNGDIRFADANGNSLPFEIEKWDSSGESHVWVSVPSLSGQATTITMYYGAITGKLPPVDSTGVWSLAGYQNVHHFSDASGYMDIESSANNLTVTRQGANTVDAAGVLGSSLANTGNNLLGLSVATSSCWMWEAGGTVTFSAWGKRTSDTSNRYLFGTTGAFGYANESTFTTTPSISYGKAWRRSMARSQNARTSSRDVQRCTSGFT